MKSIKNITKKYKNCTFCELSSLSYKKLCECNSLVLYRLSEKEVFQLLAKLSLLSCVAVEHKGLIYLCRDKKNYNDAIKQIRLLSN